MVETILTIQHVKYTGHGSMPNTEKPLPFRSNPAPVYEENYHLVISEMAQLINNNKIDGKKLKRGETLDIPSYNLLSRYIATSPSLEYEDGQAQKDFARLIETYLFADQRLNVVHSYLYSFISVASDQKIPAPLSNMAKFCRDVLFGDCEEAAQLFKNDKADDVLTKLIINELSQLTSDKTSKQAMRENTNVLPVLTKWFRNDLLYLKNHPSYLLSNLELLINYYAFAYIMQFLIKAQQFSEADFETVEPLYYTLAEEVVTKTRDAAKPYRGYKRVQEAAKYGFAHYEVLRQLSHNAFNLEKDEKPVMTYDEIARRAEAIGKSDQLKEELKEWMARYAEVMGSRVPDVATDHFDELLKAHVQSVHQNMKKSAKDRFANSITRLGKEHFLKLRGPLGYVLTLDHRLLMLLTAVIVGDEPKPLSVVLEGFEKRGIALDRYTIAQIVDIFTVQNILDNKSDSGDTQYVKPIL
ncbi:MAG TPA: DNA phosphorothioation-dependent restriction protein DptG [Savagea sp.]